MDVIHRVGLGRDVLFGGLGDGVVFGDVCHCVCFFGEVLCYIWYSYALIVDKG